MPYGWRWQATPHGRHANTPCFHPFQPIGPHYAMFPRVVYYPKIGFNRYVPTHKLHIVDLFNLFINLSIKGILSRVHRHNFIGLDEIEKI